MAAGAAAQPEAPAVAAGRGLGTGQEIVEIRRQRQVLLGEPVLAHIQVEHHVLQRQVVGLAVRRARQPPQVLGDIGPPGPGGDPRIQRLQRLHFHQPGLVQELHHAAVRRVAGDQRRVEPRVVVGAAAPGDTLGLHLDAGVRLLEIGHQRRRRGGGVVEMVPPAHRHRLLGVGCGERRGDKQREKDGGEGAHGGRTPMRLFKHRTMGRGSGVVNCEHVKS